MIHLISSATKEKFEQAMKYADTNDWLVICIEQQLETSTQLFIENSLFPQFPKSGYLCENGLAKNSKSDNRHITYDHFIRLCEEEPRIMSWF